jgi:hypothetical protein
MSFTTKLDIVSAFNVASSETHDPYYDPEGIGTEGRLPPVFFLDSFSITVGAYLEPTGEGGSTDGYSIVDVRLSSGDTDVFSYTDNGLTITIETGTTSPFNDYYEFLSTPEGELPENLPSANLEVIEYDIAVEDGYVALIKWYEPDPTVVPRTHSFEIDILNSFANTVSTVTRSYVQNVYFDYRLMVPKIIDLANTGVY